jgi:hypothetical protein
MRSRNNTIFENNQLFKFESLIKTIPESFGCFLMKNEFCE